MLVFCGVAWSQTGGCTSCTNKAFIDTVDVTGCGDDTNVIFSGTAIYYQPYNVTCLTYWYKAEGGPYFIPAEGWNPLIRHCNSPSPWTFSMDFDPGTYIFRAETSHQNGTNSAWYQVTFTVPQCSCQ